MKKLLVILVVAISIFMVGCGQETKASNQNEAERKEYVDSSGNDIQTIDDEYAQNLELNSKTNR